MEGDRRFLVIIKSPFQGMMGTLFGEVDYAGCRTGWHTLEFTDGEGRVKRGLFAGDEIVEEKELVR